MSVTRLHGQQARVVTLSLAKNPLNHREIRKRRIRRCQWHVVLP